MLRPSYTELMELLNSDPEIDNKISSRYTIVIAVAKRARKLIDGVMPLTYATTDKAVSVAVNEMNQGFIKIRTMDNKNEGIFADEENTAE